MKSQKSKVKSQNYNLKFKTFALCAVALSFAFYALRLVSAQEAVRSFTVVPPSIQLSLAPGEKTERPLKIRNEGDVPLTFTAMVRDFIVTDKAGTPEILPPGEAPERWAASTWMMIDPDTLTVGPKKTGEVMLYLQVPPEAKPGGRYTSVVFEPAESAGGAGQTGAAVITQIGSLVYLQVQGPITERAQVVKFTAPRFLEYGPVKISTEIKNLGDLHIKPAGQITIFDTLGQKKISLELSEYNIFPTAARIYENTWGQKWGFGRYRAELAATYGLNKNLPLSGSLYFWIIPYKVVAVVVLAIVIIALLIIYLRRKKSTGQVETPPPTVPPSG